MINTSDIVKLTKYQQEIFATKKDLGLLESRLGKKFDKLQTSVDGIAKIVKDHGQEITVHNQKFQEIDNFLGRAGPKIGLGYKL